MKHLLLTVFFILLFCLFGFAQDDSKAKSKTSSSQKANSQSSAKESQVEGIVRLRVTFLASGEIGEIKVVSGLSKYLNEQAIAAARKIKFEPAKKNGVPYTITKNVEYNFKLYTFKENDEELQKNAEITTMPLPTYPKDSNLSGKVKLTLTLFPNGNVKVSDVKSNLPKEFEENAREAASKIKFNPAIHKNGNAVSQSKEIEYEFKPQKD